MSINTRIKEARKNKGITQEQLGEMIGVAKTTITGYEKNREPSAAKLGEIADVLGVDANFLFQDEVKVLQENHISTEEMKHIKKYRVLDDYGKETVSLILDRELHRTEQIHQHIDDSNTQATRVIQYYQKLASAGTGEVIFQDMPVDRILIPDIPEYKRVSYAIGVNGHSMEPLYNDGDMLLVEPTCQIEIGEIGIFIIEDKAYVKKLGEKELISLNKGYNNIPLTSDAKCMGRVVDKIKFSIK